MGSPQAVLERKYDWAREALADMWNEITSLRAEVAAWEKAAGIGACSTPQELETYLNGTE